MNRIVNILLASALIGILASCTDSKSGNTVIDEPDPKPTEILINLSSPYRWALSSVPADALLFPEASLVNDVTYGKNRALLAWYTIDQVFTQRNSPDAPDYIKNDLDGLSYPYAREVSINEVYPDHDLKDGESSVIPTLNLSFYPSERGQYNLDATNVDEYGHLLYPERRWGGIMCFLTRQYNNFESAGVNCLQFWLLDPFMDPDLGNHDGGFLYFNLGDVSEDILKDGLMSFENGLPDNGESTAAIQTVWGKVPSQAPVTYAFDNSSSTRIHKDVGFDGLLTAEEFVHPSYAQFIEDLKRKLPASTVASMREDPFSPINDPASDNYAFYLHTYYDQSKASIIERYKHYVGTEGNSLSPAEANDRQHQTSRSIPDIEDIDLNFSLNENERYFQYRIAIVPDSMRVGSNYITDKHVANVRTRNGQAQVATWYQFTIPLNEYERKIGSINDFSYIRYVRMFMTGFKGTTHLRFATLGFVHAE